MKQALSLARLAYDQGEIPVGAVVIKEGEILGKGYNRQSKDNDPTAHAEVVALREAAIKENNFRLDNAEIYVTIKPCKMCQEAIKRARIKKVYYTAPAAIESTHKTEYMEMTEYSREGSEILKKFFRDRR